MVQVLINLIENSIKFGRQSATREITVGVEGLEDHVAVKVSDTGPGIPRHALKKVFDDFYRVEDALDPHHRRYGHRAVAGQKIRDGHGRHGNGRQLHRPGLYDNVADASRLTHNPLCLAFWPFTPMIPCMTRPPIFIRI